MWYPVALLGAAFLLQAVAEDHPHPRAKRLTTFGKTPTTETEPKIPRGKECRSDDDCAALEYTTCKVDTDHKHRCLCHDLLPPANGECVTKKRDVGELFWPVKPKEPAVTTKAPPLFEPYADSSPLELHQACNYDHECIHGAECIVNGTVKANEKRCYCRFGYEEEDNTCNSGYPLSALVSLVLFMTLALVATQTN